MNVSLTPELEQFVAEQVAAGRYGSASEAVRDALRLLQKREAKLESLRTSVGVGLAELDRGDALPGEHVFAELPGNLNETGPAPGYLRGDPEDLVHLDWSKERPG